MEGKSSKDLLLRLISEMGRLTDEIVKLQDLISRFEVGLRADLMRGRDS
jgi:hypothetical protein